ncbi:MAG: HAD family phosphatase [Dysgonamonadaceae bacterium]|jgi:HAD superfamily hydrolase (TIGR01509 family)|nr:HAD family phosphatase [Dysgonamonadaceae bacterium]
MKANCVLFDLDGVIIDTEPQYDIFWGKMGEDYRLGIANFAHKIKGTTLPNILSTYFSHLSEEEQAELCRKNREWELQMDLPLIPGAMEFIGELKRKGVKTGLVTSSDNIKLKRVFETLHLDGVFDTVVSADRITQGKPDPMCYLLAAADLGVPPEQCIVFEDSFPGIAAGNAAGMAVIGLSTTNTKEAIREMVEMVIPDFVGITMDR